ncbi:hypothetical protein Pelo_7133 [Pelomyxa schiedti]|nr:hypothetical protein Pelo_7133 [Pelomyxa schiedti]
MDFFSEREEMSDKRPITEFTFTVHTWARDQALAVCCGMAVTPTWRCARGSPVRIVTASIMQELCQSWVLGRAGQCACATDAVAWGDAKADHPCGCLATFRVSPTGGVCSVPVCVDDVPKRSAVVGQLDTVGHVLLRALPGLWSGKLQRWDTRDNRRDTVGGSEEMFGTGEVVAACNPHWVVALGQSSTEETHVIVVRVWKVVDTLIQSTSTTFEVPQKFEQVQFTCFSSSIEPGNEISLFPRRDSISSFQVLTVDLATNHTSLSSLNWQGREFCSWSVDLPTNHSSFSLLNSRQEFCRRKVNWSQFILKSAATRGGTAFIAADSGFAHLFSVPSGEIGTFYGMWIFCSGSQVVRLDQGCHLIHDVDDEAQGTKVFTKAPFGNVATSFGLMPTHPCMLMLETVERSLAGIEVNAEEKEVLTRTGTLWNPKTNHSVVTLKVVRKWVSDSE